MWSKGKPADRRSPAFAVARRHPPRGHRINRSELRGSCCFHHLAISTSAPTSQQAGLVVASFETRKQRRSADKRGARPSSERQYLGRARAVSFIHGPSLLEAKTFPNDYRLPPRSPDEPVPQRPSSRAARVKTRHQGAPTSGFTIILFSLPGPEVFVSASEILHLEKRLWLLDRPGPIASAMERKGP